MSGIEQIPEQCRLKAYDNCNATWRSVAVQSSGEVKIANGEKLITSETILATAASGGTVLGSGVIERIKLKVPEYNCSGSVTYRDFTSSGLLQGIMVGGKSGQQPFAPEVLSGYYCISSGKGLFLAPGDQETLFVQNINEVYVCGIPSGYPITYLGEVVSC